MSTLFDMMNFMCRINLKWRKKFPHFLQQQLHNNSFPAKTLPGASLLNELYLKCRTVHGRTSNSVDTWLCQAHFYALPCKEINQGCYVLYCFPILYTVLYTVARLFCCCSSFEGSQSTRINIKHNNSINSFWSWFILVELYNCRVDDNMW